MNVHGIIYKITPEDTFILNKTKHYMQIQK